MEEDMCCRDREPRREGVSGNRSAHSGHRQIQREDGSLSRDDFTFSKDRNVYVCPQGKLLHTTGRIHDGETILYRARTSDCGPCPLKPKCRPKAPERKIPRSIYEDARDAARALADTEAFEQSRRDRKRKRVEMLFAHLKRILRLGNFTLGPYTDGIPTGPLFPCAVC
jgi:hypothetical protein